MDESKDNPTIRTEEFTRIYPDQKIRYGYFLRNYRYVTKGELHWSWAIEYIHDNVKATNYNYSRFHWTAVLAARWALVKAAWAVAKERREQA